MGNRVQVSGECTGVLGDNDVGEHSGVEVGRGTQIGWEPGEVAVVVGKFKPIRFSCGLGIRSVGLPCADKAGDESRSLTLLSVGTDEPKLKS